MRLWFAFLRGINLGKRQVKMAELRSAMEDGGFAAVKTVLASGNVRFRSDRSETEVRSALEALIEARFGFPVGVVLRSEEAFRRMLDNHPFGSLDPDADLTRHVVLFDHTLPAGLVIPDRPGHTEILRIDDREVFLAGYRQPDGRYTEGIEGVLKPLYAALPKGVLDTARNWNTMGKMLG